MRQVNGLGGCRSSRFCVFCGVVNFESCGRPVGRPYRGCGNVGSGAQPLRGSGGVRDVAPCSRAVRSNMGLSDDGGVADSAGVGVDGMVIVIQTSSDLPDG